uniref:Uncharacterized protein n=1 Tax=Panagrolaimus sp. JU765 TaxID=591449 RepID=A0AC34PW35_9BILA
MARVKDELMDEEDGEINDLYDQDRAPTPPPPQRYRSRSRSVEFELAPSYQPNGEIERAPVEFQEITQEYQDSTTGCEYVTTCYSREQKDVDLKPADNTAGFSGYVRNCVDAIDRGRNLIFVANDPLAKAKVEEFVFIFKLC